MAGEWPVSRPVDLDDLAVELDRAVSVFRGGRPAQAVRILTSVRRRAESLTDHVAADGSGTDPEFVLAATIVARSLMSESAPRFDIDGDLRGALDLLARASALAELVGSAELEATIRGQRALVVLRSGDTRAALRAFDHAVVTLDDAPARDRAVVMLNRGVLHLEHTDLVRAESDLRRSAELSAEVGDARLEAMARHNLGYVEFLAGRIPRALAVLEQAQRLNPEDPHPATLLDRARVMREAGLLGEAERVLEQAGATLLRSRLFQDLGETELARAECALVLGNPKQARVLARRCPDVGSCGGATCVGPGGRSWSPCVATVTWLPTIKVGGRCRVVSPRWRHRASVLSEECHAEGRPDLARDALLLAQECALRSGDPGPRVLPSLRGRDSLQSRLHACEVRALSAAGRGEDRRALREVARGLTELGQYQNSLGSLDLRTASAVHGSALARLGLDVALRSGSPAAVLHLVERARAVSTRLPRVRPPEDETSAGLVSELRRVEEGARALAGDAAAVDALQALRQRAAVLQRELRARAWEVEGRTGTAVSAPAWACCATPLARTRWSS